MPTLPDVNLWPDAEHALDYLRRADSIPHRVEGEAALLEFVPVEARRILDLGSGGGRLLALVKSARPRAQFVGLDFSPTMLDVLYKLFANDGSVTIVSHDFENEIPPMGLFDAVISSFAIHHVSHERKRTLYQEIFELLAPAAHSVILSTSLLRLPVSTPSSSRRFPGRMGIHRTSCSILKLSWRGCAKLASSMWTATGNGVNWHRSRASSHP